MVDKRIEHDFKLMSVVAIIGVLAMFLFINSESLGSASLTGFVISEAGATLPAHCEDSDGGLDYSTKGYVNGNLPRGFKSEDSCLWGFFLREVYCKGDQVASRLVYCSHGCSNGFCKQRSAPPRCGDGSVNGIEQCDGADLKGKTCTTLGFIGGDLGCTRTCVLNASGCTTPVCGNGIKEIHESCDGADLNGKTCNSFNFAGGTLQCYENCRFDITKCFKICSSDLDCRERVCAGVEVHETCESGICVLRSNCSEVKCAKEGEYTSGTVAPQYQFGCCAGLRSFNPHPEMDGGGMLCYNPEKGTPVCKRQGSVEGWYYPRTGQLLKTDTCLKNVSIQTSCTDSDGGKNYAVKGVTYGESQAGAGPEVKNWIDSCVDNQILREFSCRTLTYLESNPLDVWNDLYTCPNGCKDGACIKEPVVTSGCTDSDGGKNYAVKGTIKNSYGISATDGCGARISTLCGDGISPIGDNECLKKALVEYYCGGNSVSSPIKVGDIIKLDNMDCNYIGYAMDGYVSIGCGTSGIQRAPMGADGGFTITQPWTNKQFKFYVINLGTINSNIRSDEPLLMFENIKCPYTCSEGACVEQPINITSCGDGIVSPGEECDGANLGSMTCALLGFNYGVLSCDSSCNLNTQGCFLYANVSYCGDSMVQAPNNAGFNEQCDSLNLNNKGCINFGNFVGGTLGCQNDCTYDFSGCIENITARCGDGLRNNDLEECDSSDLAGMTCLELGYASGVLRCTSGCKFDKTGCIMPPNYCGNQLLNAGEQCEGGLWATLKCSDFGFSSGSLSCVSCKLSTSSCVGVAGGWCGDNILSVGEQCDSSVSSSLTCADFGFISGTLKCTNCQYDTTACTFEAPPKICGDGSRNQEMEECDGADLAGASCASLGFSSGVLTCGNDCKFNKAGCKIASSGVVYISPASSAVVAGNTFTMDIGVLGITDIYGYQFDIAYNPSVLEFVSIQSSSFLGSSDQLFCMNGDSSTSGSIKNVLCTKVGSLPGTSGSGSLDKIVFKAIASGASEVSISNAKMSASDNSLIVFNITNAVVKVSGAIPTLYCGDGLIQAPNNAGFNEQCDSSNLNNKACSDFGNFTGGILKCYSNCNFDFSGCLVPINYCGNGVIDSGEECDYRSNAIGKACADLGYFSGSLRCTPECNFDKSGCIVNPPKICGDGIIQVPNDVGFNEQCDGNSLNSKTCTQMGNFAGGTLYCNGDCTFNLVDCIIINPARCGDRIINQQSEECDGADLKDLSCVALGFDSGALACTNDCKLDKSSCAIVDQPRCGDGTINQNTEACDGADLGGKTCIDLGYVSTQGLECSGSCAFDPRGCSMCNNNGVCQPRMGETSDNCKGDCIASPVGVALFTNPGAIDVNAGDIVTLDISVSSITDLYGYQFSIGYSPEILQFISLTEGSFLSDTTTQPFCMSPTGTLGALSNIACTRTGPVPGVSGTGLLKKITFKALKTGASNIAFSNVKMVNSGSNPITMQIFSGQISVS